MDWRKQLPLFSSSQEGEKPAGTTFVIPPSQLSPGPDVDSPTLMASWLLKQIYLAGTLLATFTAEPETPPTGALTAQLLIGGDIVWSQTQEEELLLLDAGTHFWGSNFDFSEDFINPVEYARGRNLQLGGSYMFRTSPESHTSTGALGGYFPDLGKGFEVGGPFTPNGTLSYASVDLSGHRTL